MRNTQSKLAAAVLVALALVLVNTLPAGAWSGIFDKSFSGDGVATANPSSGEDDAGAVAIQGDGRIVVAGTAFFATNNWDFAVARFLQNGKIDKTFSGDGVARISFGPGQDAAEAVAITPNGRIVVAGSSQQANTDFAFARLANNGHLDKNFASGGKLTLNEGSGDYVKGIAVQPDGKIVFVGRSGSPQHGVVGRLKSGGGLDTTLDTDGYQSVTWGSSSSVVNAVTLRPSGKIVVAGSLGPNPTDVGVAQLLPTGAFDVSGFGVAGETKKSFGSRGADAYDIALAGKKAVVAGHRNGANGGDVILLRYTARGKPDATFGSGGTVITDLGGEETGDAVAVATDGKILVTGSYSNKSMSGIYIMRYRANGQLNGTFGENGLVEPTGTFGEGPDVALQENGRIVVCAATAPNGAHFWVGRLLPS